MHDKYVDTLRQFLVGKRVMPFWIYLYLAVYLTIEISFDRQPRKVPSWWFCNINRWRWAVCRYVCVVPQPQDQEPLREFVRLEHYIPMIQELSNDKSVTKYSTHLVYMTSANNPKEIEHKIIYSILNKTKARRHLLVCASWIRSTTPTPANT